VFSYRHAFHAGNHADVLKHLVLVQVLDYLNRKDAPWWLIAGAGIYDLGSKWARASGEAQSGIKRLLAAATDGYVPALVQSYLDALYAIDQHAHKIVHTSVHTSASDNTSSRPLRWYAGSPWLGLHAMRAQDRLRLFEMHPSESEVLAHNIGCLPASQQRRIELRRTDGFGGLAALLPPPARRGLVLIDPSYEDKRDYRRVLQTVREALGRFAGGSYCIWHPLVARVDVAKEIEKLLKGLQALAPGDWLHATLSVSQPPAVAQGGGHGLYGSGVFLLHPPWTLAASLRDTLPWLARVLAQDGQASFQLHTGTAAKNARINPKPAQRSPQRAYSSRPFKPRIPPAPPAAPV